MKALTAAEYAKWIRSARQHTATSTYHIDQMCRIYNKATCPWEMRSDEDSQVASKAARIAEGILNKHIGWYEDENGRLHARKSLSPPW